MAAIKNYIIEDENGVDYSAMYVGATSDIKAMYKSIARNQNNGIIPMFCDSPKFSENKQVYALDIDSNGYMTVVNSDTAMSILLQHGVI